MSGFCLTKIKNNMKLNRHSWTSNEIDIIRQHRLCSATVIKNTLFKNSTDISVKAIQRKKDHLRGEHLERNNKVLQQWEIDYMKNNPTASNEHLSIHLKRKPDIIDRIRHKIKRDIQSWSDGKVKIFNLDAVKLLDRKLISDLIILDPPYKLWDDDRMRNDLLVKSFYSLSAKSYIICFCNPTVPDSKGKRRHDRIIEHAVAVGYTFKYEFLWIQNKPNPKLKYPSGRNTRVLIFSKGSPSLEKYSMEHTEKSISRVSKVPARRSRGGTVLPSGIYTPNPKGRTITDVLDQYGCDIPFYEDLKQSDAVNIGGSGLDAKRIQSKPPGLMRTLLKCFGNDKSIVMDPFAGSGTTGSVSIELDIKCILGDIDPMCIDYLKSKFN